MKLGLRFYLASALWIIALHSPRTAFAEEDVSPRVGGFFDAHVHLNDLAAQLDTMARLRVSRAVVFWGHASDNVDILQAARLHPVQFVPFLSVSPERESTYGAWWRDGDPKLLEYVEAELRRGTYRGIGELSLVHFPSRGFPETEVSPLHPLMRGIMRLAETYRLPVMIHCETTYARELSALLDLHPSVSVIWAHGGYAPLYWTDRVIKAHPNLTVELSMRMVHGHPRSPDYWIMESPGRVWPAWLELIERNPTRFIVGSDSAQRDSQTDSQRVTSVFQLLSQLNEETRARVAYKNLDQLLRRARGPSSDLPPKDSASPLPSRKKRTERTLDRSSGSPRENEPPN